MKDSTTQASKGFGFVCFSSADEAARAIADKNRSLFMGRPITVNLAQVRLLIGCATMQWQLCHGTFRFDTTALRAFSCPTISSFDPPPGPLPALNLAAPVFFRLPVHLPF